MRYEGRVDVGSLGTRWWLVAWTAVIVGGSSVMLFQSYDATEDGLRAVLRLTARTSLGLFLAAFLASSIRARWLLANRRYLGVSFATSHAIHFSAILALTRVSDHGPDPATVVFGGLGFVLIAAMTATSFDRTAAWLGPRRWKQLHRTGLYYVWFIFALTFLGNVGKDPVAIFSFAALLAALAFRLVPRNRLQGAS